MRENESNQIESKIKIIAGIILSVFLILFVRLWILQIMEGATIMARSRENQTRVIRINAPRGIFYDRNGEILVTTRISRNVSVVPDDLKNKPEVIALLSRILKMPETEIREKLKPDPKTSINNPYQYVTIKKDIDPTTVIKLLEAQLDLPGVEVDEIPLRYYKYGEFASHLFGYIREVNDQELQELKGEGYRLGDLIGKSGLERTYEQYLRGVDGGKIFEVDIHGRRIGKLETRDPEPGDNLHLTINYKVQQAAEEALEEQLLYLQKNTKYRRAKSGVALAIDPRNGDILALVSKPGYDPNLFVGSLTQEVFDKIYKSPLFPLMNRAIRGEFAPGSTFKPITVLSALMEKKATINDHFYCNGYDPIWKSKFKCWTVSSKTVTVHGRQNIIDGLKNSCNIVMAELSRRVGPDMLAKYSRLLGLGRVTGLNLYPGEKAGLVPDPDWKRKNTRDKKWYPLETLHFGIGQGYLTVTPLQLAQVYAAIADNGKVFRPRVVTKITDSFGKVVKSYRPTVTSNLRIPPEDLAIVKKGLEEVVSEGTAAAFFRGFPLDRIPVAGKTGTAQRPPYDNTAVFAAYAPADKPEIVIVTLVEQGGSGSSGAAPIARKMLEAYFNLDSKLKTAVTPSASTTQTPAETGTRPMVNSGATDVPSANATTAGQTGQPSSVPVSPPEPGR